MSWTHTDTTCRSRGGDRARRGGQGTAHGTASGSAATRRGRRFPGGGRRLGLSSVSPRTGMSGRGRAEKVLCSRPRGKDQQTWERTQRETANSQTGTGREKTQGPHQLWFGDTRLCAPLPSAAGPDGHSSSSQLSVRWPLLCRRMPTSLPADRRLQRELFPELARLLYLLRPLPSSSQPGRGGRPLATSPASAVTSSGASVGGSQPSISSGFLD